MLVEVLIYLATIVWMVIGEDLRVKIIICLIWKLCAYLRKYGTKTKYNDSL